MAILLDRVHNPTLRSIRRIETVRANNPIPFEPYSISMGLPSRAER